MTFAMLSLSLRRVSKQLKKGWVKKMVDIDKVSFSLQETAEIIGVPVKTVRRFIDEGILKKMRGCDKPQRILIFEICKHLGAPVDEVKAALTPVKQRTIRIFRTNRGLYRPRYNKRTKK